MNDDDISCGMAKSSISLYEIEIELRDFRVDDSCVLQIPLSRMGGCSHLQYLLHVCVVVFNERPTELEKNIFIHYTRILKN